MSYEVKFGYITGQSLVFTAYQPDGTGRGIPEQLLPELADGYYAGSPTTDLVAGDEVIAYAIDNVTYGGDIVYILTYGSVFWEGDRVFVDSEWVYSFDTVDIISEAVTSVGAVVGAQEYTAPSDWYDLLSASISTISGSVGSIGAISNINDSGLDANGNPRIINEGQIGYVEEFMKGI